MVMNPLGLETKNHCAGEDQQLFTVLNYTENYGATNGAPSQKGPPLASSKMSPYF
jgi:hypothetical protein